MSQKSIFCSLSSFRIKAVKQGHTVSFDWFLSSFEWILHLEFCLLKLLIFYQKLLWKIRSRLNSSTFWVLIKIEALSTKMKIFDQTYLNTDSKSLWLEMGNLNHLLFGMILNLDIGLLHPSGLLRHEISQKKWKKPKNFLKATSKTR